MAGGCSSSLHLFVASLVDDGLRELRVDGAAARLVAVLAEHQALADVLGLYVAAVAALHFLLKEEGRELVEADGVAARIELAQAYERDEHDAAHRDADVAAARRLPVRGTGRRVAVLIPRAVLLD